MCHFGSRRQIVYYAPAYPQGSSNTARGCSNVVPVTYPAPGTAGSTRISVTGSTPAAPLGFALQTTETQFQARRSQSMLHALGHERFAEIIPTIRSRLPVTHPAPSNGIQVTEHTNAAAIETTMRALRPHAPCAEGIAMEFNRVITFSLPQGSLPPEISTFRYGREANGQPYTASFPNERLRANHISSRVGDLYEVHTHQVDGRDVYTIALTHRFVGGVRISANGQSQLLLSHVESQPTTVAVPKAILQEPATYISKMPLPEVALTIPQENELHSRSASALTAPKRVSISPTGASPSEFALLPPIAIQPSTFTPVLPALLEKQPDDIKDLAVTIGAMKSPYNYSGEGPSAIPQLQQPLQTQNRYAVQEGN